MRVFLTGATGFIGSALVPELITGGHRVVGLTRSDAGAAALARAGAEVFRGDVNDLDDLRVGAEGADGVIHAAFNHDFTDVRASSEADRLVIETLGEALGADRPLVISSGTGLARRSTAGAPAVETDEHVTSAEFPRGASEEAADAVSARGGRVLVMRLSQVHDTRHQGRIAEHIRLAREKGWVAYVGAGENRVSAVHVSDAVRLYRLVLENGRPGARYNAVAEEGIAFRDIAEAIGSGMGVPVESITTDQVAGYFGPLAPLAAIDLAASSALTRRELGRTPTGPGFLSDLRDTDYGAA